VFIHKGYVVFVSLDKKGAKIPVVPYLPETPAEMAEFDEGTKRKAKRIVQQSG